ncbi:MAG: hypothetical protein LBK53_03420, partial [Heliobacteriaceae bacterium]|nr:hypothetical protein [Heliobacteriaceae bacterium]
MSVQAVDVSDFAQLQNALSPNTAEINLKASIDATAKLKVLNNTTDPSLTINGSGFYLDGGKTHSGINIRNLGAITLNITNNIIFKNFSGDTTYNTNQTINNGAIYNSSDSDASIIIIGDNVRFLDNNAKSAGGAIYNHGGAGAQIKIGDNAVFSGNSATYGSAIYNAGFSGGQIIIGDNNVFSDNSGGAIYNQGTSGTAQIKIGDNNVFSDNSGDAAIRNVAYADAQIIIGDNNVFSGNSGGAINSENSYDTVQIKIGDNNVFSGNSADAGGAVCQANVIMSQVNANDSLVIGSGSTFESNNASSIGGAIYQYMTEQYTSSGISELTNSLSIGANSTFNNNSTSTDAGGAIYQGVIVWNNSAKTNNTLTISDGTVFSNNRSGGHGGVIYSRIYSFAASTDVNTLTIGDNVTFSGNKATGLGGAINFQLHHTNASGSAKAELNITTNGGTTLFTNNTDSSGLNDIYLNGTAGIDMNINILGNSGKVVFESG